jgi:hypothetical protein
MRRVFRSLPRSSRRASARRALGNGGAARVSAVLALLAVVVFVVGGLSACSSYRMVRHATALGDVQRVAIQPLRNESYEPGVDRLVTDALRREFSRRGGVQLVRNAAGADLVLSGAVLPLTTRSRSFSSVELALEFEVELPLRLVAERPDGRRLDLDRSVLRDWELYLASADVEVERKNREEALRRLSQLLAGRVHDALAERLAAAQ